MSRLGIESANLIGEEAEGMIVPEKRNVVIPKC